MISKELRTFYEKIHEDSPFGKRRKFPDYLQEFIYDKKPKSVLDFGCGKGNLVKTLKDVYPDINVIGYDPANSKFNTQLRPVDMIISTDVLEHIEPNVIDDVIRLLASMSSLQYHLISCAPAKLILPDGRNAHLIQESSTWWKKKFTDNGFQVLREDYREFTKFSKQLRKEMPVKNYYIMVEKQNG